MRLHMNLASLGLVTLIAGACSDDGAGGGNEGEVITTVTLSFVAAGVAPVTASFDDLDGDGGDPPIIDPINLANGTTYTTLVRLLNKLEDPPEEITLEVADESDEHQLFFTGTAVNGPASDQPGAPLTHAYADADGNGLPIGLTNTFVAATGSGQLTLTLRHLPPVNDTPTKTADLAAQVKTGGFASVGGETDVSVSFMATVQ